MKKRQGSLIDFTCFADIFLEVISMKIGSIIQSLVGSKTHSASEMKTSSEKSIGEAVLDDYKSKEVHLDKPLQSIFDKYQITPNAETAKQVGAFMKKASGTEAQKLEAVEVALYKGIEPTEDNLMAIHSALTHDAEVVETLIERPLMSEFKLSDQDIVKIVRTLKLPEEVKNALITKVKEGASLKDALIQIGEQFGIVIEKSDTPTDVLLKLSELHLPKLNYTEPVMGKSVVDQSMEKPVEMILPEQNKAIKDFVIKDAEVTKTNRSVETDQLTESDQVMESDQTAETSQSELDSNALDWLSMMEEAVQNVMEQSTSVLHALVDQMPVKAYLIEKATEATIKAKETFETFRKETLQLLESIQKPENKPNLAADLTKAVEKVNQIILKSDVTLFTDMHTEKKLLVMSSELDRALVLIKNGALGKAKEIVKEAAKLLGEIKMNPSQRRIQVFSQNNLDRYADVLKGEMQGYERGQERLDVHIRQQLSGNREPAMARDVLETLRFLGLNHEMEVAESLEQNRLETFKAWNQSNVKEILLKLMKEDIENRTVSGVEQNLMNMTGQQMMNDSGTKEQPFYFFNLPILEDEALGNMKVYMKGATRNHQIDWQNAELYFGVSEKGASPIGIKVKVQDRKLDIELLADDNSVLLANLEGVLNQMEEIGFDKGTLKSKQYAGSEMKPTLKPAIPEQPSFAASEVKGFDFKV